MKILKFVGIALFALAFVWLSVRPFLHSEIVRLGSEPAVLGAKTGFSKWWHRNFWRNKDKRKNNPASEEKLKMLKDVGEPFYPNFGLTISDFETMRAAGVDIIESNFDICAGHEDVKWYLDTAHTHGIKVILNAGSGEAEWGYECDAAVSPNQKPVLRLDLITDWVNTWKDHPAIYAWDTSNEAGGNFPNALRLAAESKSWEEEFSISLEDLKAVYAAVKEADPAHRVMVRMNGWYFYDHDADFFRTGNPFGPGMADLVMINAYSNVTPRDPEFVSAVLRKANSAIQEVDPHIKLIASLAAWQEPPIFDQMPTPEILRGEIEDTLWAANVETVAFFKYGASEGEDWLLPDSSRGNTGLWQVIAEMK